MPDGLASSKTPNPKVPNTDDEDYMTGVYLTDDEIIDSLEEEEAQKILNNHGRVSRPYKSYAYAMFGYDKTLRNRLANVDRTSFNDWIDEIMTHVQSYFRHHSLPTKIEFKVTALKI